MTAVADRIHGSTIIVFAEGRLSGSDCKHKAMKFFASDDMGFQISLGKKVNSARLHSASSSIDARAASSSAWNGACPESMK
mmetsp:Transcript_109013/g.233009  ORF Transcript_109013/g.233009 Transcript_109013/m.233009 type:complete len:81 (+) Transcript_109013:900-1142(+)